MAGLEGAGPPGLAGGCLTGSAEGVAGADVVLPNAIAKEVNVMQERGWYLI